MIIEYKEKVKKEVVVEETREVEIRRYYDVNVVKKERDGTLKTIRRVTDFASKPDEQTIADILIPYIKIDVFATVFENYKIIKK